MTSISTMTNAELAAAAQSFNRANNEGGEGYNPYEQELDRRYSEAAKATKASFAAEWTADVTAERESAWNEAVMANMPAGKLDATGLAALISKIESIVGFDYRDLQNAIQLHK